MIASFSMFAMFATYRVKVEQIILLMKCLHLASEKFVLSSEPNLSLATGLAS